MKGECLIKTLRKILGVLFIGIGALHFIHEHKFTKIVPHYLPFRKLAVWISGIVEIFIGLKLLFQRPSSCMKTAINFFLLSVFPANIYMARKEIKLGDKQLPKAVLYLRLPLQFVLMRIIRAL